jgi:hypothetical protein
MMSRCPVALAVERDPEPNLGRSWLFVICEKSMGHEGPHINTAGSADIRWWIGEDARARASHRTQEGSGQANGG